MTQGTGFTVNAPGGCRLSRDVEEIPPDGFAGASIDRLARLENICKEVLGCGPQRHGMERGSAWV